MYLVTARLVCFSIWNSKPSVGRSAGYGSPALVQFIQFADSGQLQLSPGANRHAFPGDGRVYIFRLVLRHQETVNSVGSNRVVHEGETIARRVFAARLMTWWADGWKESEENLELVVSNTDLLEICEII
ncbi:predicted protein [Histoplasma capsulatum var. duboisii H88]|uniref:Predicted protein n=1 Tax=Ajellomyces capsulatus (strain H88) TaxID=544711 RepID=F0UKQ6_AJEC8|nr:predicted protein [Histoplasma capsulatum var. duboisii H88]